MLNGGRTQDELGQPQRRVVPGVEPGRLPAGDLLAAVQRRDVAEVTEQAPQHALGLGIHARNGEHRLTCRPQDPGLRDVDSELVVLDLQRQRESMMPAQLLAFEAIAQSYEGGPERIATIETAEGHLRVGEQRPRLPSPPACGRAGPAEGAGDAAATAHELG